MITLNGTIFVDPQTNKENLDYYLEDSKSKVTTIDADWISDFWDKAKNISSEETQNIWGSVLYFNFVNGTCTKTSLNALYLIEKRGI